MYKHIKDQLDAINHLQHLILKNKLKNFIKKRNNITYIVRLINECNKENRETRHQKCKIVVNNERRILFRGRVIKVGYEDNAIGRARNTIRQLVKVYKFYAYNSDQLPEYWKVGYTSKQAESVI